MATRTTKNKQEKRIYLEDFKKILYFTLKTITVNNRTRLLWYNSAIHGCQYGRENTCEFYEVNQEKTLSSLELYIMNVINCKLITSR